MPDLLGDRVRMTEGPEPTPRFTALAEDQARALLAWGACGSEQDAPGVQSPWLWLSLARMSHWEGPIPGSYAVASTPLSTRIHGSSPGVSRQTHPNHKAAGSHHALCTEPTLSLSWLGIPATARACFFCVPVSNVNSGAEKLHPSSPSHIAFDQRLT